VQVTAVIAVTTTPATPSDFALRPTIEAYLATRPLTPREQIVDTGSVTSDYLWPSRTEHSIDQTLTRIAFCPHCCNRAPQTTIAMHTCMMTFWFEGAAKDELVDYDGT
jgi:hypothetical protein